MIGGILDGENGVGLKIRRCLQDDIASCNSIDKLERVYISTIALFINGIPPVTTTEYIDIVSNISFQEIIAAPPSRTSLPALARI